MIRFETHLQPNWDWRAACNFIFGGTGSALLLLSALAAYPDIPALPLLVVSWALIALGLLCVWLEIGRPWRFINVFLHPHTSWMSREATLAVGLLLLSVVGAYVGNAVVVLLGGIVGLGFLASQGKILQASKGIPAWREPAIVYLIILTGLCEGSAVLLSFGVATGTTGHETLEYSGLFVLLLLARAFTWRHYQTRLLRQWAPDALARTLTRNRVTLVYFGTLLPVALTAVFLGSLSTARAGSQGWPDLLVHAGSAIALLSGWYAKWNIVSRASHVQGYALATRIQRGRPKLRPPIVRNRYR